MKKLKRNTLKSNAKRILKTIRRDVAVTIAEWATQSERKEKYEEELTRKALKGTYNKLKANDFSFKNAGRISLAEVDSPQRANSTVVFRGYIASVPKPQCLTYQYPNSEDEKWYRRLYTKIEIADGADRAISTAITDKELLAKVMEYRKKKASYLFHATIVNIPTGKRRSTSMILLHDIKKVTSPLQLLNCTLKEIAEAEALIDKYSKFDGGLLRFFKSEVVEIRNIKGLEHATDLSQALDFSITQAASGGKLENTHGKVHSFLIGPPGSGKKLIGDAASMLNPIFNEVQPAKLSMAGLCGTTKNVDGVWVSEPGYLPLSDQGALSCQDFHHVSNGVKNEVVNVLAQSMEDGVIRDSKAARETYEAHVAIVLDANRISDITQQNRKDVNPIEDISAPTHMISRMDLCCEIPKNAEVQFNTALERYGPKTLGVSSIKAVKGEQQRIRRLKVMVACLHQRHRTITTSADVADYMRNKHAKLKARNKDNMEALENLGDYMNRLHNSVYKLASAGARLNNRSETTPYDVDRAFEFIHTKMKFLVKNVIPGLKLAATWEQKNTPRARQAFIIKTFGGQTVSLKKIKAAIYKMLKVTDDGSFDRTIRRDLSVVACKVPGKKGYFQVRKH
jgi:hypothetical protein